MSYWHEMSYNKYRILASQQRLEMECEEMYEDIDEQTWNEWIYEEVV